MKKTETDKVKDKLTKLGFDRVIDRYKVTPERIKKMPVKAITEASAYQKMKSWYYNPIYFYPDGVKLLEHEIGHDRRNRYTLKVKKNENN